ncbi:hypothetical protein UA08_00195 [Talaromyces atroroseus]|uniref:Fe2OG dioxygenase domain-containing protein n=1 Tax=Talaromyces atroroseus TaxID=1441469 RepID=A0A225BC12_TALAT|nr:hypothetical protein UA08_00195 [Talaromyces atroroseus]OKL64445.1 hypothetical protein UA08_00195 [Talaromyces atroroseus]
MAAPNIISAPLLPATPLMNEYCAPQENSQKAPQEVISEVTHEVPQEQSKTETPITDVLESPQDVSQEVTSEMTQEGPQEKSETETPTETVIETPQGEMGQEIPEEKFQEIKQESPVEAVLEIPQEPQEAAQGIHSEAIQDAPSEQEPNVVEEAPLPSPTNKNKPIIPVRESLPPSERVAFDPAKHIKFTPPSKVWTMQELDYPEGKGISPVGVSEPFPLFSEDAIKQMRAEIFSEEVWDKYQYSSNLSHCQLRGYAPECAPFIYDAWRSPEVLEIISKVAGIDLVPVMDWEIAHINIAVQSEEEKSKELEIAHRNADEGVAGCPLEDDHPVVGWHTDSYPFVCVTMLSDCTDMVGGETMLRKGNGATVKVRGPQIGSAVILQGRYIEHQALRALGAAERITSVTSFRPRSSAVKDETVLTTVRPISDLKELYHQYAEYRFEILQDRLRDMERKMRDLKRANRPFDTEGTKAFIREQIQFFETMDQQMVSDQYVQKGYIGDDHLVSDETRENFKKRGIYVEAAAA